MTLLKRLEETARSIEGAYYSSTQAAATIREAKATIERLSAELDQRTWALEDVRDNLLCGTVECQTCKPIRKRIDAALTHAPRQDVEQAEVQR